VITIGMPEYELKALPWKADKAVPNGEDGSIMSLIQPESKDDDATIYTYHSDNPNLVELKVTVKDHRVSAVNGGNG